MTVVAFSCYASIYSVVRTDFYAMQKGYTSFQLIANENRKAFNQTRKIDPWG
jgi:hypothetical protein